MDWLESREKFMVRIRITYEFVIYEMFYLLLLFSYKTDFDLKILLIGSGTLLKRGVNFVNTPRDKGGWARPWAEAWFAWDACRGDAWWVTKTAQRSSNGWEIAGFPNKRSSQPRLWNGTICCRLRWKRRAASTARLLECRCQHPASRVADHQLRTLWRQEIASYPVNVNALCNHSFCDRAITDDVMRFPAELAPFTESRHRRGNLSASTRVSRQFPPLLHKVVQRGCSESPSLRP